MRRRERGEQGRQSFIVNLNPIVYQYCIKTGSMFLNGQYVGQWAPNLGDDYIRAWLAYNNGVPKERVTTSRTIGFQYGIPQDPNQT